MTTETLSRVSRRMTELVDLALEAELAGDYETSLKHMQEWHKLEAQMDDYADARNDRDNEPDYGGAFDGVNVTSDADPGL